MSNKISKSQAMINDTKERIEINSFIIDLVKQGKSKVEILISLYNKYPTSNQAKRFEQLVNYHFEKKDKYCSNKSSFVKNDIVR